MNTTSTIVNEKMLYNVKEVAEIMQTNTAYVYKLIKSKKLLAIKLGSYKVRCETLNNFFAANEGNDLTDPFTIKPYFVTGGAC